MRVIVEIPTLNEEHTVEALVTLLDAVARVGLIVEKELGPAPELYSSGVRFQPEPFDDGEHFDLPWAVLERGWGDCDDLTIWRRMELARRGEATKARVVWREDTRRYHAQIRREDGSWEDPSLMLKEET